MANNLTPVNQFILGAFIAVSIGVFAFLDAYFNTQFFWAVVAGYGIVATAYGIYLMENSTAISSYWKYVAIIVVTTIAFALTSLANQWMAIRTTTDPVLIAGFVLVVANFALNDLSNYVNFLPENVVSEITFILGGIVVVAESVQNAPAGSIVNITTLLTIAVPVIMVYLFQRIPWPPATTTPADVPAGAAT